MTRSPNTFYTERDFLSHKLKGKGFLQLHHYPYKCKHSCLNIFFQKSTVKYSSIVLYIHVHYLLDLLALALLQSSLENLGLFITYPI